MIPSTTVPIETIKQDKSEQNKDFKILTTDDITFISGTCEGIEAVKQAIYIVLSVNRYVNVIYNWDVGIELGDLIGQQRSIVAAKLQKRIREALLQDNRIIAVDSFNISYRKNGVVDCSFTVTTIYGSVSAGLEVRT